MLAVTKDDVSDVPDAQSVDKDISDLDLLTDSRAILGQFENISGTEDENILLAVTHFTGDLGLRLQVTVFTVDRNGKSGLYQMIDQLDILLAGVSRRMYILGNDVGALHQELIDYCRNRLFVARNRAGRKDNGIAGADGHLSVHTVRHTAESGHALALASCCNDDGLFARIVFELIDVDQGVLRHIEHIKVGSCLDDIDHAAAFDHDLAAIFISMVDDLLHTVHVGREGGDNDARIRVVAEDLIDVSAHSLFGRGMSGALRIGGVAHEGKHALVAELCKTLQIDRISVYGCVIDFKISGVDNGSRRGFDGQRGSIHDAVVGLDEFYIKVSELDDISERYNMPFCNLQQIVFAELVFDDAHGQACSVDRNIDLFQNIRKGTDMILVSVCDDKSLHLVNILFQIGSVRNDKIDAEHIVLREGKTAVHDHDTVSVLERSDIHADLLQASQRDDPDSRCGPAVHIHFIVQTISSSKAAPPSAQLYVPACISLLSVRSYFFFRIDSRSVQPGFLCRGTGCCLESGPVFDIFPWLVLIIVILARALLFSGRFFLSNLFLF